MGTIARCNGTLLVEEGRRVGVVQQGDGWLGPAIIVATLLALTAAVNGVLQLFLRPVVGLGILGLAVLASIATAAFMRRQNAQLEARAATSPWLVFDLEASVLRDKGGAVLAPLEQVKLRRSWQLTSSSNALRLELPDASLVIARGNPFGASVAEIEDALRARGIKG